METVILYRNTRNSRIGFVSKDDGDIAVYPSHDAAVSDVPNVPILRVYPYQIVELEEL